VEVHLAAVSQINMAVSFLEAPRRPKKYQSKKDAKLKWAGRSEEAIADFLKAQSIDPKDQASKEQLRGLGA
jgi:hypothetical protein